MKRLGFLLGGVCAGSAVCVLSAAVAAPIDPAPFGTLLRPTFAWGPSLLILLVAAFVIARPHPVFIGIRGRLLALVALAVAFLWPAYAFAQDASGTSVGLGGIFSDVRGYIEAIAIVVVGGILGLVTAMVRKSTGLNVDGKMRETLQSAAVNGVHLGLDKVQELADKTTIDVKSTVIAEGIGYVRKFAPLAVKHFGLSEADIAEIVRAKLASLQPAETVAVAKATGA